MSNLLLESTDRHVRYIPNLLRWYAWHVKQGSLPERWVGRTLPEICFDLRVPVWDVARPYVLDYGRVAVEKEEMDGQRVITYRSHSGILVERWDLGPDGDWWQTEYAVKGQEDLQILLEIVEERTYRLDTESLHVKQQTVAGAGMVGLELPRRPFSQIFLEWLGWGDGLMLLWDAPDLISEILDILEAKVQAFVEEIGAIAGQVVVSPDNLDAQFISPPFFQQYLAASYRASAERLHQRGKFLLINTGGPIRSLLKPLSACAIDGIQGISGPPQCDASLAEARDLVGPDVVLWGGIPQDALMHDFPRQDFEDVVRQAAGEARAAKPAVIGIADCVPPETDPERLMVLSTLIEEFIS